MADLSNPFCGNVPRKISQEELVQALRADIAGELEAIINYDAHVMACEDERAKTVLGSIRDEERAHVGELQALLKLLDPKETQYLDQGTHEVNQLLGVNV
jgi:rubrerythrin